MRIETIGDCTLYLGDCLDVLPTLADGSVDAVVTDPPFSIPHNFSKAVGKRGTRILSWDWDNDMTRERVVEAISLSCAHARSFFTFCGLSQATLIADALAELRFTCKPAAWVKTCPPPAGHGNWWPSGMQMAVYGYRKGAWFGDADVKRTNVFFADSYRHGNPDKNGHPTQTPLVLMQRFVESLVPPGGLCFDPFMGSGTTGVACVKAGRKFIGIEREPTYFDIACRRIQKAVDQPDMFVANDNAPTATQVAAGDLFDATNVAA